MEQQLNPSRADLEKISGNHAALYQREDPPPPGAATPKPFFPLPERVWGAVRGKIGNRSFPAEAKQGQRAYLSPGKTPSGVSLGGIPSKEVDPPQPVSMRETGGAGTTYVGV